MTSSIRFFKPAVIKMNYSNINRRYVTVQSYLKVTLIKVLAYYECSKQTNSPNSKNHSVSRNRALWRCYFNNQFSNDFQTQLEIQFYHETVQHRTLDVCQKHA